MLRLDDVRYRATQPNSDVLLGLSDVSKLETPVVLDLNFDIKVLNSELSFQNHLEGKYPSRAHHPMPLDMEGLPDVESRQLLVTMVDVIYAFQQRVQMAATEVLNIYLGSQS